MNKSVRIFLEIIWWVVAIAFAFAVLYPVLTQSHYFHTMVNVGIIAVAFSYIRYVATFKTLFFLKHKYVRVGWFIVNIFLFIFILNRLEYVLGAYDSFAFGDLFLHTDLALTEEKNLAQYITKEFTIASIAAFVTIIAFNFRILASFFRNSKLKKEVLLTNSNKK